MSALRFALLSAATISLTAGSAVAPLRIIRTTPVGESGPLPAITVTFDRPVAGSLDRSVDPASVLKVEPAIPGRLEWRDPVTIRLIPSAPLPADTRYTVTVANTFTAMDGERLPEPASFSFRVRGPVLLAQGQLRADQVLEFATPDQRFDLIYSAPVDPARLAATAFIELSGACSGGNRVNRIRVVGQRRITNDDTWQVRESGRYQRERSVDSLRRVVQVAPERPLPHGCGGSLVAPTEITAGQSQGLQRFAFSTYGDFRISTASCNYATSAHCPRGPAVISFTTPVRGAEVQRLVKIFPATPFTVRDTAATSAHWVLEGTLVPNRNYAVVADTSLRDIFGQKLTGNPAAGVRTTGFATAVSYPFGRQLVERVGFQTLAVQHVNADTLVALIAPIPDSLEASFLSSYGWSDNEKWLKVAPRAVTQRIPVKAGTDTTTITGLRLPVVDASRPGASTLFAVRVMPTRRGATGENPVSLVQVTDLGVTARIGMEEGAVWVTGVSDGLPKAGARVVLRGPDGRTIATGQTDARGLARLTGYRFAPGEVSDDNDEGSSLEGYVSATLGNDRGVVAVNRYDPDLSPWNFGVPSAWGDARNPLAGAVFTDRGIYRPGEQLFAKAIVRTGNLGALVTPARTDSVKWIFTDREGEEIADTTTGLSEFGTAAHTLTVPANAPIGQYGVRIQMKRLGAWREVAWAGYRVAEYRPPEFLVDVNATETPTHPGEKFRVGVKARYLFGAPMGRAELRWTARQTPVGAWELDIPGTDGWQIGEMGWWWDDDGDDNTQFFANGTDTLDARGELSVETTLPPARTTRAARVTIEATVTDVNRQTVGSSATTLVHPASFYIASKSKSDSWFWKAGEAQALMVRAVRPNGTAESGVRVRGKLVRREWHQVRRERNGIAELVGEWVSDTVARCTVTTSSSATDGPTCALTPAAGGMHMVIFEATDVQGRRAATSFGRYVAGTGFVPWSDETQFKMDVLADRERYSVGDTATVMLASPFTDAEAWVTVEREGIIEQRRMRLTSGTTMLKFPITEAYAPNAFVSVVVARGRTAQPGTVDDPGRPTIRVGYTQLRVTPEVKRLAVQVQTLASEYRPGDSARVRLTVRDRRGAGARSEVTLWAVDEGVLALTGYKTPDPISLLYRERGLGMRLSSNLVSVAPQIPEGEKGRREAGGGGGATGAEVLRSRFKTTAFFLGSVVTDAAGNATVSAKLPDNLTTFRVMAVAVTAGDRYGSGESPMLVTRPLVARPALPRFVRPGDQLTAGTVVNRRDGTASDVRVTATATGIERTGPAAKTATLAAGRGAEVRFGFRARPGDSATFRFDVRGGNDVDAVQLNIPVKPDYHPRSYTIAGVLRDTASAEFLLPEDIDPARSRLTLNLGTSPLAIIRGIQADLHVYPYYCTEQVVSVATPLLALMRAERALPGISGGRGRADAERAVAMLSARQRPDGGIGYWSAADWSTPWLSAYAAHVLLDAREVGIAVDSGVVARLADYLRATLRGEREVTRTPVNTWYERRSTRLADQVAAVDVLSRLGTPDVGAENELVRMAAQMNREDRIRLATVLHRRGATAPARQIIAAAWSEVRIEGRRAVLPPEPDRFYFESEVRDEARLLIATLAIEPTHALIGPLVETLVQQGRAQRRYFWNTQDFAFVVQGLAAFEQTSRNAVGRAVRVRAGSRTILQAAQTGATTGVIQGDTSVALDGLLDRPQNEQRALRVALDMPPGPSAAMYYYLTVTEVPLRPPVRPDDAGIRVERWYERYDDSRPITSVVEGDLVRVRLKVTIPALRHFVVLDDALPAGLEAIDLSLRTATSLPGPAAAQEDRESGRTDDDTMWGYGSWDSGWWSPWDHRELRDDRVVYAATLLWPGTYTATYVARATTPGVFIRPPAHAEEMYNPAVHGRSDGGTFTVTERPPR